MIKNKTRLLFIATLLLAATLRFWDLGKVPLSPDWDEAALGYNAYSIFHTGRDEYGKFLPVVLRSFDDYKPALYAYLIIPFLPFFDLTVLTVRLPSALIGVITVGAVYFLVKELFKESYVEWIALLSSFLLAISPWHLQFSRVAFEANVGLGFNILMVLFFLKGLRDPKYFLLSVIYAVLSLYTYQSEKVFTPLLMLALIIIYNKKLIEFFKNKSTKKYLYFTFSIGIIVMFPFVQYTVTHPEAFARAKGVSIFSQQTSLLKDDIQRLARDKERQDYVGAVFDNRRIIYAKTILGNYLSHFDMVWLFITGDYDINRHHAPGMGLEYIVFLPFLFIGMYQLVFGNFDKKTKLVLFSWFLLAPVPASITNGVPHAVRTLNFLPTIQVFIALGFITIVMFIKKYHVVRSKYYVVLFLVICYMILITCNFVYYLDQYFVQQNYYNAQDWQYGYKELVEFLQPVQSKYKKIVVSNSSEMSQSYMYFLFYTKYDPEKYLEHGGTGSGGFETKGNRFGNFEFRPFNIYKEAGSDIVFVGNPGDFSEEFNMLFRIKYPNGNTSMKVVEKD